LRIPADVNIRRFELLLTKRRKNFGRPHVLWTEARRVLLPYP
jgi:hypothetical protein